MRKVLVIGDMHLPFVNLNNFRKLTAIAKALNPELIIQIGDLYDFFSFSKYARSHNIIKPRVEIETGLTMANDMWRDFHKACPNAKLVQLLGNHCFRAQKRVMEKLPEFESLKTWQVLFQFPKVKTIFDPNVEYEFDDVLYTHGWGTKVGQHLTYYNQSVVVGHSHRPHTYYKKNKNNMFELNVGWMGDDTHPVFDYRHSKRSNWVQSYGVIDEQGPRVCLFV